MSDWLGKEHRQSSEDAARDKLLARRRANAAEPSKALDRAPPATLREVHVGELGISNIESGWTTWSTNRCGGDGRDTRR
jgi:hypothetical protein